jgi:hypothetical protein
MKPVSIRERLHLFLDAIPVATLNEIYYLLATNYKDQFKTAFLGEDDEEISKTEADLIMQQYLA